MESTSNKTNCLAFALRHFVYGRNDMIIVRKSFWGWFPHFKVAYLLHDDSLVIKEFRPLKPSRKWFPPLFFKGEVVTTTYKLTTQTIEPFFKESKWKHFLNGKFM